MAFDNARQIRGLAPRAVRRLCRRVAGFLDHVAQELEQPGLNKADRVVLERNARFSMRYNGRRAFVIGTGPSLKQQDLRRLRHELTFAVNSFWRHPILAEWQPTSLSIADPLSFDGRLVWDNYFAGMRRAVTSGVFFVPLSAGEVIRARALLPDDRTFYCAFFGSMERVVKFTVDLTQPIPGCQSVSQFALMVALHMGCNPIYLLGMDHDWLSYRAEPSHFYDILPSVQDSEEICNLAKLPYDDLMASGVRLWRGYRNLKRIAESNGYRIYNATAGGFLDVFERVRYESLF